MRAAVNPLTGTRRRATVPGGDCGHASDEAAHHHCGLRCRALPPGHTCRIGKKHRSGGASPSAIPGQTGMAAPQTAGRTGGSVMANRLSISAEANRGATRHGTAEADRAYCLVSAGLRSAEEHLTVRWMYDASTPPPNPPHWHVAAGYIGGGTPPQGAPVGGEHPGAPG